MSQINGGLTSGLALSSGKEMELAQSFSKLWVVTCRQEVKSVQWVKPALEKEVEIQLYPIECG